MAIAKFPPLETTTEEGLLAIGGDLDVSTLLLSYRSGIFPWPISDEISLAWFSPNPRGVLYTKNLHIPRSLGKVINQERFTITLNRAFEEVIQACSSVERKHQDGTWITEEMVEAYIELYRRGYAYSVEAWRDNQLVGGMYGVNIGRFFSGESMFFFERDASKVVLVTFVQWLGRHEVLWLDTQMVTPVTHSLGAIEIFERSFYR